MTDLELERSAMSPRIWIELCQKEHSNDSSDSETLQSRTTRIISNKDPNRSFFLMVPGGRYLVSAGRV